MTLKYINNDIIIQTIYSRQNKQRQNVHSFKQLNIRTNLYSERNNFLVKK